MSNSQFFLIFPHGPSPFSSLLWFAFIVLESGRVRSQTMDPWTSSCPVAEVHFHTREFWHGTRVIDTDNGRAISRPITSGIIRPAKTLKSTFDGIFVTSWQSC